MFGSTLEIPLPILEHLKKIGHGPKFVNTSLMKKRGGSIRNGWVPLLLPEELRQKMPSNPFSPSEAKDYYVVGDLVLASKSLGDIAAHREYLSNKAEIQTESIYSEQDAKGRNMLYERGE